MKKIFLICVCLSIFLLLPACKTSKPSDRASNKLANTQNLNVLLPASMKFYPKGTFKDADGNPDTTFQKYYSSVLEDMKYFYFEGRYLGVERYRLLLTQPDNNFLGIEVYMKLDYISINWREISRDSAENGARPIVNYKEMYLKTNEIAKIHKLVEESEFWKSDTQLMTNSELEAMKTPGQKELWIMEGETHDGYHAVVRNKLSRKDKLSKLFKYLISLTDYELD